MGNLTLNGSTSGSITIAPPAVAGTNTLTLPASTGTVALTASPTFSGTVTATTITSPSATALTIQSASTTALTIDTSQNVGIGTTSPGFKLDVNGVARVNNAALAVQSTGSAALPSSGYGWEIYNVNSTTNYLQSYNRTGGAYMNSVYNSLSHQFYISGSESARIDSSGNLLVGTTSQGGSYNGRFVTSTGSGLNGILVKDTQANGAIASFVNSSNALAGTITISGTTTTYGTSSDYRLKENVVPITTGLTTISALKPVTYDWIDDKSKGEGFIAHELQAIIPLAVNGEKDAINEDGTIKPQNVDYSKIVVHLVAAMQEQQATINALNARIAALEAK